MRDQVEPETERVLNLVPRQFLHEASREELGTKPDRKAVIDLLESQMPTELPRAGPEDAQPDLNTDGPLRLPLHSLGPEALAAEANLCAAGHRANRAPLRRKPPNGKEAGGHRCESGRGVFRGDLFQQQAPPRSG